MALTRTMSLAKTECDTPLIEETTGRMLARIAATFPENEALVAVWQNRRLTYRDFFRECRRAAKAFLNLGVKKGDSVAILSTNNPEWVFCQFSLPMIGATLVTVNPAFKQHELEYLLKDSDSKALILIKEFKSSDYLSMINGICPELKKSAPGELASRALPLLKNVIFVGGEGHPGMHRWEDFIKSGDGVPDAELDRIEASLDVHDVINMQYTSGTTGFPKGVCLTHHNIVNNGFFVGENLRFTEKDRLCIPVPFFHCFGLVLAMMAALTHNTSIVPIDYFRPVWVMDALQSERCTAVHGVPTMYIAMLEHKDFPKYKFNLRTGIMAGSPCPIEVMKKVVSEMGMREITISYGQTEASPVCTMTTTDDSLERRVSTVGKAMPGIECRIVDPETGAECPDGVPGEFVARGYNIMRGYYNMPEATALAIDKDGWLHSGDLATRDEKGYYKITGRIKDMIIRGGENIYPKEIEEFLYTQEAVSDVQVIGVPSRQYGEEIMACIILKKGYAMTADEVKDLVAANMARHKVPKYVEFVDSFPLTASGKIQKYKMRDWAVKLLGLEDEADIETA